MANVNIDPTSPAYNQLHGRFTALRNNLRPHLKVFQRLDPDDQEAWLANDPLLNDVMTWCRTLARGNDDG